VCVSSGTYTNGQLCSVLKAISPSKSEQHSLKTGRKINKAKKRAIKSNTYAKGKQDQVLAP